jgi:Flp pilus assembly pilin Flp|tara:strand:- start:515 stop:694 length:180 start_codon:yes stop_codon:yes gene_type:complete
MRRFFQNFARNQSGAISVDWVVLTAFLVALTILSLGLFSDSVNVLVKDIEEGLAAQSSS